MADEIKQIGIDCAALSLGAQPIERKQYYSQTFLMSPEFFTNKAFVNIKGKNFDFVQLLRRN
jgi:hypothetical protein